MTVNIKECLTLFQINSTPSILLHIPFRINGIAYKTDFFRVYNSADTGLPYSTFGIRCLIFLIINRANMAKLQIFLAF